MKKIFLIVAFLISLTAFSQTRKPVFNVPDSTTVYGVSLPSNHLIYDSGSKRIWALTSPAASSDNISTSTKTLIVEGGAVVTPNLSQVLTEGNTTGGNNILLDPLDYIEWDVNGGNQTFFRNKLNNITFAENFGGDLWISNLLTGKDIVLETNSANSDLKLQTSLGNIDFLTGGSGSVLMQNGNLLGVGIGVTPTAKLQVKGAGLDNTTDNLLLEDFNGVDLLRVSDLGHVGHNAAPNTSIQHYMVGDGSTYGMRIDGTHTTSHFGTIGGAPQGAFACHSFASGTGVWIEGDPGATATRYGGRFHLYGSNTGANIGLTIRAENGVGDIAIDALSGEIVMSTSGKAAPTSAATQNGSDKFIMRTQLWNGASATNNLFSIQPVPSAVTNELTNLDFEYNGTKVMSVTSGLRVGIGTTLPTEKLDVTGNIAVSGTVDGVDVSTLVSALKTKAGTVLNATFTGNPKTATVTFSTAFADTIYSPVITCETVSGASYNPVVESIGVGSFIINMTVNNINDLTAVRWVAIKNGEN